ncbi:predicted protein [Uncinocarpus reesii 1704]|uniref:E3 ubiquitin-protein ligase CCNB1IP1 n=1 Tax=Uncinocarpus reesii (strain UAMH 1704) TaxID=336963 RepID=C4JPX4_UNCRE|nr:uncharacterized protein UREG_04617 [Uncinocarpus reesii 1704]EEP79771.1 predicted protein [Uncinocarpus reesii 1704]
MECAGRALAFWTYQTAQEMYAVVGLGMIYAIHGTYHQRSFYQEYLGKNLTDKYTALNKQMDKVIHDANSEMSSLHQRIADLKMNQEQLQKKNQELVELYRDKSKKHTQITNLYNILKSRTMRSQLQTAVSDTVAHTLQNLGTSGTHTSNGFEPNSHLTLSNSRPVQYGEACLGSNNNTVDQLHRRQRSGSSNNQISNTMMPPPSGMPSSFRQSNVPQTTSHRTQIPPPSRAMNTAEARQHQSQRNFVSPNRLFNLSHRSPNNSDPTRGLHTSPNNYGLSAGVKIGRPVDPTTVNTDIPGGMFSRPIL